MEGDINSLFTRKVFIFVVLAISGLAFYLVIKGFMIPVLSALLIAYVSYPLKKFFDRKLNSRLSSALIILLIILILFFIIYFFSRELYVQLESYMTEERIASAFGYFSGFFSWLPSSIQENLIQLRSQASNFLLTATVSFISGLPGILLSIFVTLFLIYFFLLDFSKLEEAIKIFPFKNREKLYSRIGATSRKIVYGYTTIAVIEFFISLAGFYFSGTPIYLVLALLVGLSVFIPMVGPMTIWLPVFLIYLFQQNYYSAVVILIMGVILTGFIDNFLGYILVGRGSNVHPVILMLGVLGGIPLYGIFGFILGPLTIIIFMELAKEIFGDKHVIGAEKREKQI